MRFEGQSGATITAAPTTRVSAAWLIIDFVTKPEVRGNDEIARAPTMPHSIVIGMVCTLAAARLLRGLLYGVSPTDPLTLSVTPVALLVVAFVAGWTAARRAAGVEPAEALRSQ